jgi:dTDP-4-dehydrorhamnose 3,5-epimerase
MSSKPSKYQAPSRRRIDGVEVKSLKVNADERGRLMEILRCDEPMFRKFGQVYLTTAYPGVTKAWHFHRKQDDHMCVVRGMMKIVCYDNRKGSPTKGVINEFFAGEYNPILVRIPANVYHGFKCISDTEAVVINTVTQPYDYKNPDEFRLPAHTKKIPYDWSRQDG